MSCGILSEGFPLEENIMRRAIAIAATTLVLILAAGGVGAQETRPAPGGGALGPGQPGQHPGPRGGGMMGMPGGMGMGSEMMGMGGGMMGMPGREHLEHLMVHNPKAAARILRFRGDMLRAISDVLQKHAAELEKAQ
jgi:hypothetical protein